MHLENRIERLEKQNRRLQILATVAIVAALLPWLSGGKEAVDDVRAKNLVLLDSDGKVRGGWAISEDGNSRLFISGSSKDGAPAAMLTANAEGASVRIERDGHVQGMLSSTKDGATFATFRDGKIEWARPPLFAE